MFWRHVCDKGHLGIGGSHRSSGMRRRVPHGTRSSEGAGAMNARSPRVQRPPASPSLSGAAPRETTPARFSLLIPHCPPPSSSPWSSGALLKSLKSQLPKGQTMEANSVLHFLLGVWGFSLPSDRASHPLKARLSTDRYAHTWTVLLRGPHSILHQRFLTLAAQLNHEGVFKNNDSWISTPEGLN